MLLALTFIAVGAVCLIFPRQLLRLYADAFRRRHFRVRRPGETLLLFRALGVLFILFGAYIGWKG
jgi:hypothetical protein